MVCETTPLILEATAGKSFPAAGGFSFSLSSGKGEKKEHPVNPVNPVCPAPCNTKSIALG
jgi:hypothetical protein